MEKGKKTFFSIPFLTPRCSPPLSWILYPLHTSPKYIFRDINLIIGFGDVCVCVSTACVIICFYIYNYIYIDCHYYFASLVGHRSVLPSLHHHHILWSLHSLPLDHVRCHLPLPSRSYCQRVAIVSRVASLLVCSGFYNSCLMYGPVVFLVVVRRIGLGLTVLWCRFWVHERT